MKNRGVVLRCQHGLHLRVAATVAGIARGHGSTAVRLSCGHCQNANACSVLELLTLEAGRGAQLEITAEGPDEAVVVERLAQLFEDGEGI